MIRQLLRKIKKRLEPPRRVVKTTVQGSYAEVMRINNCDHTFRPDRVVLLDYIECDFVCDRCGTRKASK